MTAPEKRSVRKAARRNSLNRRREDASQSRTLNPWPRAGEVTARQLTPEELEAHQARLQAKRQQRGQPMPAYKMPGTLGRGQPSA